MMGQELRPPVAALARLVELLPEDAAALEVHQLHAMVSAVHYGARALTALVENVLTAAALRDGRFRSWPQPVNLLDVVMEILPVTEGLLAQQDQWLRLQSRRELPRVLADGQQISQVITTLIANASEVTERGTPIGVVLTRRGGVVRLTVADRGPKLLDRGVGQRLERRYRPGAAAPLGEEGARLGLAVVQAVIAAHGGQSGARNRRGGGACFWFELTVRDDDGDVVGADQLLGASGALGGDEGVHQRSGLARNRRLRPRVPTSAGLDSTVQ
jgi:K+-sensing histidine kinase KdpD